MLFIFFVRNFLEIDTNAPLAFFIKKNIPDARIKFILFSKDVDELLTMNRNHKSAIDSCGKTYLYCGRKKWPLRLSGKIKFLFFKMKLTLWVVLSKKPTLFYKRTYNKGIMPVLFVLTAIRGGKAYVLHGTKAVETVRFRALIAKNIKARPPLNILNNIFPQWDSGLILYHDQQSYLVSSYCGESRDCLSKIRIIGVPGLCREWEDFIREQTVIEREKLFRLGEKEMAMVFSIIGSKDYSSNFLKSPLSMERSLTKTLRVIGREVPQAKVLFRPHPRALKDHYMINSFIAVPEVDVELTFIHLEILAQLSSRLIMHSPSDVMSSVYSGRMLDCSDYSDADREYLQGKSVGDGWGIVWVDPQCDDFEATFSSMMLDDEMFDQAASSELRNDFLRKNRLDRNAAMKLFG